MSFGDPNNPYGPPQQQPPQGQQPPPYPGYPGYPGHPQQQQPGYGYPQAPPIPQGGYGYLAPQEMPGLVKAARVLLFVIGGFQLLGGAVFGVIGAVAGSGAGSLDTDDRTALAVIFILVAVVLLALGALSIFLGVKQRSGGNGIRVTTIVYAALMVVGSLVNLVITLADANSGAVGGGGLSISFGGVILAAMVNHKDWFTRPRY